MNSGPRGVETTEALSAVVGLVSTWSAASTQGAIAQNLGLGIAETDVRGLYVIGLRGGSLRPAELAEELWLSRPTVSKLVTRLTKAGLVTRSGDTTDGRSVRLVLTAEGASAYARLVEAGMQVTERAMRGLSDAERDRFVGVLRELERGFAAGDEAG